MIEPDYESIYALFEYYGDGFMSPHNFLCIRHGEPGRILTWLLNDGYLQEVYILGQMMGVSGDEYYLDEIYRLMQMDINEVTAETIQKIDIQLPSCCSCKAICKDMSEMPAFRDKVKELLEEADIDTVAKDEALDDFLQSLDEACEDAAMYENFQHIIPYRYI